MLVTGIYRHYKGAHYRVLGVAQHTETEEVLAVYTNEEGRLWVRPYNMFTELVPGTTTPRFTLVKELCETRVPIREFLQD